MTFSFPLCAATSQDCCKDETELSMNKNLAYTEQAVQLRKAEVREVHVAGVQVISNQEKRKSALYLEATVFSLSLSFQLFSCEY